MILFIYLLFYFVDSGATSNQPSMMKQRDSHGGADVTSNPRTVKTDRGM